MPRIRSAQEKAAGRLISSIQKEWMLEMGEPASAASEQAMYRAHDLQKALSAGQLTPLLGTQSIEEFLGPEWLRCHPAVQAALNALLAQIAAASR